MKLSIVIPTYNEKETLPNLIERLYDEIEPLVEELHVVIVDDSSPDGTADLARNLGEKFHKISVIQRPMKMGLGAAYKDGFKEGSRMTFHENGSLFEKETYLKGKLEGLFQGYHDNGELWWEGFAINNLRHGEIKVFHETGKLKYTGEYKFNLKEGLWEYFNEEEIINNQECYLNGEIVELSNCGI